MPAMIEGIAIAIPALPLVSALAIGCGIVSGRIAAERAEKFTSRLSLGTTGAAALLVLAFAVYSSLRHGERMQIALGTWIAGGRAPIALTLMLDPLSLAWASLVVVLSLLTLRFSVNHMHREPGYHRFFMILCLFSGAMLLLALAGNGAVAFAGWALAGVACCLLIAYAYDHTNAATGATYAFVANRIGDAAFVLGLVLSLLWLGTLEWQQLPAAAAKLDPLRRSALAACFLFAAMTKSAQLPMTPWVTRALEGPTPSTAILCGAVLTHAGVFLLLRLQALFELCPEIMMLTAVVGALTAGYGFFCGLVQSDARSALIFSTIGQLGLMFLACGLGGWAVATIHLFAHSIVRVYQFLDAPSTMQQALGLRIRPPPEWLACRQSLYVAALQRFWLEPLADRVLVRPAFRLAADLSSFDREIVEPALGCPARFTGTAAPPANGQQRDCYGLPGRLVQRLASAMYRCEECLVLSGMGSGRWHIGRRLGQRMTRIEALLCRPRYLVLLVVLSVVSIA